MNSCATAPGEHFPTTADHPPLLASSSLGFGNVLRSHFSVRKLERFMPVRLVLRRLHLRYLHSPLARLSLLGISWRLRGFLSFCWALVVCLVEFHGTVLNAREFLVDKNNNRIVSPNHVTSTRFPCPKDVPITSVYCNCSNCEVFCNIFVYSY